jgi:hypothetical protein
MVWFSGGTCAGNELSDARYVSVRCPQQWGCSLKGLWMAAGEVEPSIHIKSIAGRGLAAVDSSGST